MIHEYEIRKKLISLLADRIVLDEFEEWLVENSWNMHLNSSTEAQDLVSSIELALAEFSESHISENSLRDSLVSLASNIRADVSFEPHAVTSASSFNWQPAPATSNSSDLLELGSPRPLAATA